MRIPNLFVWFLSLMAAGLAGQTNPLDLKISGLYQDKVLLEMLQDFERQVPVKFYFEPAAIPYYRQNRQFDNTPLREVLEIVLQGSNLVQVRAGAEGIVLLKKYQVSRAFIVDLVDRWEKGTVELPKIGNLTLLEHRIGDPSSTGSRKQVRFSGVITDAGTGEPVIGATILSTGTDRGTATDVDGKFVLALSPGKNNIGVQSIGYVSIQLTLDIFEDGQLNMQMESQPFNLQEVVVEGQASDEVIRSSNLGLEALSTKAIKELPTLLGEADVVQSLQLLPGVSTVGEGASGFLVRGGNIDQNLVLQDDMPILNASHALGFFSIFNPDAVQSINLYKGHIPAQYGGRTSSVLNVQLKDGNRQQWGFQGGVSPFTARALVEGPLIKGKTALLAGGRLSYANWLLRQVKQPDANKSSARFDDAIVKLTQWFGQNSSVSVSAFRSSDFFQFVDQFGYDWRTQSLQLQWRQIINPVFTSATFAGVGDYSSSLFEPKGTAAFRLTNGVKYYKAKQEFVYFQPDKHELRFGAEWHSYRLHPEALQPLGDLSAIEPKEIQREQAQTFDFFVNEDFTFNERLALNAGIRYVIYQNLGPGLVYKYAEGVPRRNSNTTGQTQYSSGAIIQQYGGIEPRISLKYNLDSLSAFKLAYNRIRQYSHLLSNSQAATPIDIWQLSNQYVSPQTADNYAFGYVRQWNASGWEAAIEGYYKRISGLAVLKDFPKLLLNPQLETDLLPGTGQSYGLEFSIEKKKGRFTGWASYTYSRSLVQVIGNFRETTINHGDWFPGNFDQPHQINIISRWQAGPRSAFTANFVYRSGRPVTYPVGSFPAADAVIPDFSDRNQFRIPAYHRLDVAWQIDNKNYRLKGIRGNWTFSIYNLYFRRNPFSVFFRRNINNALEANRLSVIGTAIPSLTYNFIL